MAVRNGIGRASLNAIPAEDAPAVIDVINTGVALTSADPLGIGVLFGFDIDAVSRTGRRAKKAADTLLQPVLVPLQDVHAPVPFLEARGSIRVVFRDRGLKHLLEGDAHPFGDGSRRAD